MMRFRELACGLVIASVPTAAVGCGDDVLLNDGDRAIIEAHVQPSSTCKLDEDSAVVARGTFDIGAALGDKNSYCARSYELNLRVNSHRSELVLFTEAEVTLQRADGETLAFKRGNLELPNPLISKTASPVAAGKTGVVTVTAIPVPYATLLTNYVDQDVIAKVVLHGQADSGAKVSSRPFEFPISLCRFCMYQCSELVGDTDPSDIYGDLCSDDAAADDRICLDPEPSCPGGPN